MKAIKHEIIEELGMYEEKAIEGKLDHEDVDYIKDLCETLYALDKVSEMWHSHKKMSDEYVHHPTAEKTNNTGKVY